MEQLAVRLRVSDKGVFTSLIRRKQTNLKILMSIEEMFSGEGELVLTIAVSCTGQRAVPRAVKGQESRSSQQVLLRKKLPGALDLLILSHFADRLLLRVEL